MKSLLLLFIITHEPTPISRAYHWHTIAVAPVLSLRTHSLLIEHNNHWWSYVNGRWIVHHRGAWFVYKDGMFGGPPKE